MGFDGLLGNEQLKQNLRVSMEKGHISHFYLISGPAGSGKHTLARLLAAAAQCESQNRPCLQCNACRKVMAGTHPDCLTVEDSEHKNVAVKIVREARASMYVMPNEGKRKVYLFPQSLATEGQNALLKILEEPPAYGVFILLTENPETLLPTVRSRCVELNLKALPDALLERELCKLFPDADPETIANAIARSCGYLGQAKLLIESGTVQSTETKAFVKSFSERDVLILMQTLVSMERWKREDFLGELYQWVNVLQSALLWRNTPQQTPSAYSPSTITQETSVSSAPYTGTSNPYGNLSSASHNIGADSAPQKAYYAPASSTPRKEHYASTFSAPQKEHYASTFSAPRIIASTRSSSEILAAIQQLQKAIQYTQGNISVADICGHLQWSLR